MSDTELSVTASPAQVDDRPGHRLAEARKARGLSLEEVASQLRLNVNMLQALENDDYSHLPPAAYVSGYVRSYARALGLSEAELLRSNTAAPSGEPPIVGIVARSHTAQVPANDPRVKLVSWLILGGLLFISGAWWLVQREEAAPLAPETPAAVASAPVESVPATAESQAAPAAGVAMPAVPVPAPVTPVAPPAAKPSAATPAPVTKPAAPVPPAKPVAAVPATKPAAPAANAATPPVDAPAKPVPPPLTSDMPQSKVVLEFSGECWVDVVDAAGRQLAYELAPAGRKMKLHGEAPFTVFFGYSPAVHVTFNDQPFDHRPFQRKDVARFKLGTAEDNSQSTEAQ